MILEIKNYRHEKELSWSDAFAYFVEREKNITLFSNILVDGCQCEADSIRSVHGICTLDLTEHVFRAELFVDNTGDGWLGYYAGADYHIGREARWEY